MVLPFTMTGEGGNISGSLLDISQPHRSYLSQYLAQQ
jgi:hypothetical protein